MREWFWYYQSYCFGDDRADDRAMATLAAFGGEKVEWTRWPFFRPQLTEAEQLERYREIKQKQDASSRSQHDTNGRR